MQSKGMLGLPKRSDETVRNWAVWGVVAYFVLAGMLIGQLQAERSGLSELIGLGGSQNVLIFALIVAGIAVTISGFLNVRRDYITLRREEDDIDWVHEHGHSALLLVFAPSDQRQKLLEKNQLDYPLEGHEVETLMDDRVRRLVDARRSASGAPVSVESLRVLAEQRTSLLGTYPRYASSVLLLLAVLGTFAGVKTALPGLIQALSETETASGGMEGVVSGLEAVAHAFGGNALALVGALCVGIAAHGVGVGRRNLLERLELVSADYLFGSEAVESADSLEAAVASLRQGLTQFENATGHLIGIQSSFETLGSDFRSGLRGLEERLEALATAQEEGLYSRTAESLEALQRRVAELAVLTESNTRQYGGLVSVIGNRAAETNQAIEALRETTAQIALATTGLVDLGSAARDASSVVTSASENLNESNNSLSEASKTLNSELGKLSSAVQALTTAADRFSQTNDITRHASGSLSATPTLPRSVPDNRETVNAVRELAGTVMNVARSQQLIGWIVVSALALLVLGTWFNG